MDFKKYMHVERFGNDEVEGIELGECYIFPKIDGTNGSVWFNDDGSVGAGSRKRVLSVEDDNAGFCSFVEQHGSIKLFLTNYPYMRLYGEWLVPHSLKTYRDDAWKRFYVFDVFDHINEVFLHYEEYRTLLEAFEIDYIPPQCIMRNSTYENFLVELKNNVFLIEEGRGFGEGVVIKNYNYTNRFGRIVWAKIVANGFKEKHSREMGPPVKKMKESVEFQIINEFLTRDIVDKVYANIVNESGGWNSKYIQRLFGMVYYDLIKEELWNIIKKYKQPKIDFKNLYMLTVAETKRIKKELF